MVCRPNEYPRSNMQTFVNIQCDKQSRLLIKEDFVAKACGI